MGKINLLQELDLEPDITYCDDTLEHWNTFKLKDWMAQQFPWRPPFLPEEHSFALMDASAGTFRPRKGTYYIPALQTRICEQREYDFESWSDFIEACNQYPGEQQIYWLHLQQKPADWDDDVFAPFPDDGLLVFGTK